MRHHTSGRGPRRSLRTARWIAALTIAVVSGVCLSADTLIMRNGRRVNGRLVGVRGSQIEFEEGQGRRTNLLRIDRRDIRTIEFDDYDDDSNGGRPGTDYPGGGGYPGGGNPGGNPGGGWGGGQGMREQDIAVSARDEWTDSGITVRPGQSIRFRATGKVRWGPNRNDGPEGENNSPYNAGRPLPNRPAAALIGRVGDEAPFFIGSDTGVIRVRGGGRLYLAINDDYLQDNSGSFRVTVYY